MKTPWFSVVLPIMALFSFRMMGLFMLIPVFTVCATDLNGATPIWIGIALGAYGLAQGIAQIPFGLLSDKFGRKPLLYIGLILFITGSLFGAFTHSIWGMIFARILQGLGAVGSVLIALLADLTSEKQRTKAMAAIGGSIGLSFTLAMVVSPIITAHFGLAGIFNVMFFLGIIGLFILYCFIPIAKSHPSLAITDSPITFKHIITDRNLQRLNLCIFLQHAMLTATFYVIPLILKTHIQQDTLHAAWHFYLPLMGLSFVLMIPLIVLAERYHYERSIFTFSWAVMVLAQGFLSLGYASWWIFCILIGFYFWMFNYLEAQLPSMISKKANPATKGTAMGAYSTAQFLGIFAGGSLAGIVFQNFHYAGVFIMNALLGLIGVYTALSSPSQR